MTADGTFFVLSKYPVDSTVKGTIIDGVDTDWLVGKFFIHVYCLFHQK